MAETSPANGAANGQASQAQLSLQKIYAKDVSFESPGSPHIFQQSGQPNIEINLSQRVANLAENAYEVVLNVTVTCKMEDKTAYLVEVAQAGVFGVAGFDDAGRDAILATYCPNVLFPYARQLVSDMVQNGGFPPVFLQPINFEALYAEQVRRREGGQQGQTLNA